MFLNKSLIRKNIALEMLVEELEQKVVKLDNIVMNLSDDARQGRHLKETMEKIISERNELKKLVREQTEADELYKLASEHMNKNNIPSQSSIDARNRYLASLQNQFQQGVGNSFRAAQWPIEQAVIGGFYG